MDEQTRGFVAAVLWDLRARCEAQLRWLSESQQLLDPQRSAAAGLASPRSSDLRARLERVRQAALEMAEQATTSIERLAASQ